MHFPEYRIRYYLRKSLFRIEIRERSIDLWFENRGNTKSQVIQSILPNILFRVFEPIRQLFEDAMDNQLIVDIGGKGYYDLLKCSFELNSKDFQYYSNKEIRDVVAKALKLIRVYFMLLDKSKNPEVMKYV